MRRRRRGAATGRTPRRTGGQRAVSKRLQLSTASPKQPCPLLRRLAPNVAPLSELSGSCICGAPPSPDMSAMDRCSRSSTDGQCCPAAPHALQQSSQRSLLLTAATEWMNLQAHAPPSEESVYACIRPIHACNHYISTGPRLELKSEHCIEIQRSVHRSATRILESHTAPTSSET